MATKTITTAIDGEHGETVTCVNRIDDEGRPTGGTVSTEGLSIYWQNGPVQDGKRNGAFVEDALIGVVERLKFYQSTQFSCRENAIALTKIQEALHWLDHRTADRRKRGVEGKYEQ